MMSGSVRDFASKSFIFVCLTSFVALLFFCLMRVNGLKRIVTVCGKIACNTFCPAAFYEKPLYYYDTNTHPAVLVFGNIFPIVRFMAAQEVEPEEDAKQTDVSISGEIPYIEFVSAEGIENVSYNNGDDTGNSGNACNNGSEDNSSSHGDNSDNINNNASDTNNNVGGDNNSNNNGNGDGGNINNSNNYGDNSGDGSDNNAYGDNGSNNNSGGNNNNANSDNNSNMNNGSGNNGNNNSSNSDSNGSSNNANGDNGGMDSNNTQDNNYNNNSDGNVNGGYGIPAGSIPVASASVPYSYDRLISFDFVHDNFYVIPAHTALSSALLKPKEFLEMNLAVEGKKPCILLYHTHSQEAFADSSGSDMTIVQVGDYLEQLLEEKYGFDVIHIKTEFDMLGGSLDRSKAYTYAELQLTQIVKEHPEIDMVIDLHRDGVNDNLHFVTDINGKPTAKVMLFNGISYSNNQGNIDYLYNPYLKENLALTYQMYLLGKTYYPDFFRCIYIEAYRYNLHLCKRSMLIEAGAQTNTFEEVKNAMEPLSELIARELCGEKVIK